MAMTFPTIIPQGGKDDNVKVEGGVVEYKLCMNLSENELTLLRLACMLAVQEFEERKDFQNATIYREFIQELGNILKG